MVTGSTPNLDYRSLFDAVPTARHHGQALQEQRRFRVEQLRQLDDAAPPDSVQHAEVRAALRLAAETALTEIDAALGRLRDGSYGNCVRCRRPILPERLEILPAVALCMTCQQAAEMPTG